jgi:hypothetical protein
MEALPDRLRSASAWSPHQVEAYLRTYVAPLRLAVQTEAGFPLICSLWFLYEDGRLWCATKRDAKVARCLARDPRCAFELAPNEPPYRGVRGQGRASLSSEGAVELLGRLIDRYLGDRDSDLARWLLRESASEVAIAIEAEQVTSWDYTERMER